uniref:Uncharacterized protein n=1 Tax=Lepeophtheirus salmonis TaxID=72036 RepID=A0A0K2UJJ6_LEPSM
MSVLRLGQRLLLGLSDSATNFHEPSLSVSFSESILVSWSLLAFNSCFTSSFLSRVYIRISLEGLSSSKMGEAKGIWSEGTASLFNFFMAFMLRSSTWKFRSK